MSHAPCPHSALHASRSRSRGRRAVSRPFAGRTGAAAAWPAGLVPSAMVKSLVTGGRRPAANSAGLPGGEMPRFSRGRRLRSCWMDTGEVPGYEFELPRGPRHRTRQDALRPFPQDAPRAFPRDSMRPSPQDSLRPLRHEAPPTPPRASVRAAGGVLAVMRTRNWLVGLVLPIVVAVIVGIAVVVTAGGGGTGGAAPSALAAGFPPARLAGTAFTGPAGTARVMLAGIAASAGTEVLAGTADGGPALWVSPDGGSQWTRAALATGGGGQLAGVARGAAG